MGTFDDEQRWAAMIWQAHTEARHGDYSKAGALLDLVQVQAGAERERSPQSKALAALDAAVELRKSLRRMSRG